MTINESGFLLEPECYELIAGEGVPVPPYTLVKTSGEAVQKAEEYGYPVVLKVVSHQVVHKSEAGGVQLNLANSAAVIEAFDSIVHNVKIQQPDASIEGMLVMPQFQGGIELIVGGLRDTQFGPAVMFGLGGIFVELFKDVTFRVAPFSLEEAQAMIREVKGYAILSGYRGKPPLDIDALAQLLSQVSQVMTNHDRIEELDLNPVFLFSKGLVVADARIRKSERKEGSVAEHSAFT